jgi:hypothetical protein
MNVKIIGVLCLLAPILGFSQAKEVSKKKEKKGQTEEKTPRYRVGFPAAGLTFQTGMQAGALFPFLSTSLEKDGGLAGHFLSKRNEPMVPSRWYHSQLGVICKTEWKLEQTLKLPVRFRLGSLAQTNFLEGK